MSTHAVALRGTADGKDGHFLSCATPKLNKEKNRPGVPCCVVFRARPRTADGAERGIRAKRRQSNSAKFSHADESQPWKITDAANSAPRQEGVHGCIGARCDTLVFIGRGFLFFVLSFWPTRATGTFDGSTNPKLALPCQHVRLEQVSGPLSNNLGFFVHSCRMNLRLNYAAAMHNAHSKIYIEEKPGEKQVEAHDVGR